LEEGVSENQIVTIPNVFAVGDTLTIAGVMARVPNPARRWWQWWKPRMIDGPKLQKFVVTHAPAQKTGIA
jgi:hypothetical protein